MRRLVAIAVCGWLLVGCDSNPTPHPQVDASVAQDAMMETNTPGAGEYTDIDNASDCATAGGFWDGDGCRGAVDASDTIAPEVSPEVSEVDLGDGVETDDLGDGVGDAGPDSAE